MTTFVERPTREVAGDLQSLELEITGKCQLTCTHCLSESSPQAGHGVMSLDDWRTVIFDAAALGIHTIQLIGGEPTVHPHWRALTEYALSLGRHVEVYSNLYAVHEQWWELFTHPAVTLGTSYYSDEAAEHDKITGRNGSYVERDATSVRRWSGAPRSGLGSWKSFRGNVSPKLVPSCDPWA